jgi:hypothetical protein
MSVEQNLPISYLFCDSWHVHSNRTSISVTNCQCYGHPNLETRSERIHFHSSPSGKRWWVTIQYCVYIASFTIPMGTQNKIPYQRNHLIMSTPPSTPSPLNTPFPKGFVICLERISDLLHFITRINYSSYHPVRYPYNTKCMRENLIITTKDSIATRFWGGVCYGCQLCA